MIHEFDYLDTHNIQYIQINNRENHDIIMLQTAIHGTYSMSSITNFKQLLITNTQQSSQHGHQHNQKSWVCNPHHCTQPFLHNSQPRNSSMTDTQRSQLVQTISGYIISLVGDTYLQQGHSFGFPVGWRCNKLQHSLQ